MKIGYIIGGTAAVSLVAYLGYLKFWDKTQKKFVFSTKKEGVTGSVTSAAETAVNTVVKNVPKVTAAVKQITQPIRQTTGFNGPAPGPVTVPKIGDKAFAKGSANGYKSASASSTNIYKHYNQDNFIGTFLATEGIFTKLAVEESGFFSNSYVNVWVPTADLTFTSAN